MDKQLKKEKQSLNRTINKVIANDKKVDKKMKKKGCQAFAFLDGKKQCLISSCGWKMSNLITMIVYATVIIVAVSFFVKYYNKDKP